MRIVHSTTALVAIIVAFVACDQEKKAPDAQPTAKTATAAPAPKPEPAPAPTPKAPPKPSRPETIDVTLTAEKRAKLDAALPEAKGFLEMRALQEKLKSNKTLKDKGGAVAAFDRLAKGRWVLFTGPLATLTSVGFDIGVTYTPQVKGDVMGMSRQWFPVTITDVKGYDKAAFKPGQMVVVLAKYTGKQKAGPGTEVVAAGDW